MPGTTPRLGFTYEQGSDVESGFPARDQANKTLMDAAVTYAEGTLAARPAASIKGRIYKATDDNTGGPSGTYYIDTGAAWQWLTAASTAGGGVVYSEGVIASRPAAGNKGRLYKATDTTQLYLDNGSSWDPVPYGEAHFDKIGVTTAATTRRGFATIATEESTLSASFVDLATPGPSVTVTVPTNGYVAILVECGMRSTGSKVPQVGVVESTDITSGQQVIAQDNTTTITGWTVPGSTAGTASRATAGLLVFPATSGARTYKLQYRSGAAGTCWFSGRKLWVAAFSN